MEVEWQLTSCVVSLSPFWFIAAAESRPKVCSWPSAETERSPKQYTSLLLVRKPKPNFGRSLPVTYVCEGHVDRESVCHKGNNQTATVIKTSTVSWFCCFSLLTLIWSDAGSSPAVLLFPCTAALLCTFHIWVWRPICVPTRKVFSTGRTIRLCIRHYITSQLVLLRHCLPPDSCVVAAALFSAGCTLWMCICKPHCEEDFLSTWNTKIHQVNVLKIPQQPKQEGPTSLCLPYFESRACEIDADAMPASSWLLATSKTAEPTFLNILSCSAYMTAILLAHITIFVRHAPLLLLSLSIVNKVLSTATLHFANKCWWWPIGMVWHNMTNFARLIFTQNRRTDDTNRRSCFTYRSIR